jgi:phosphopantothenoylcysteine decarboxylase
MAKVLLGVTGSVAAILTPSLFEQLCRAGHQVKVVATSASLYFFDPTLLRGDQSPAGGRDPQTLILDEDEWPGRGEGRLYQRQDKVLHIELRRWADLLLIAPLDANTLAKLACGLADNCLTCVCRAWDSNRPVILAPAMNTLMWEHPATGRHLRQLAVDAGAGDLPELADWLELIDVLNRSAPRLRIVPPQSKRLACDDVGMGAMASLDDILQAVLEMGLGESGKADSPQRTQRT